VELLRDQAGVVARRQALDAGLTDNDIRRRLRRREWVVVHPGVYVEHTGPLTWLQRAWAAVLYAWPAVLCGESVQRAVDGPGRRRSDAVVHVAIAVGRRVADRDGVRVHRMAHLDDRALWNVGPPRLRYEDAVLDLAVVARTELDAIGILADACGGRRTTALRLVRSLDARERSPRRRFLDGVLADVAEGACSVLEHAYLVRVERAHRLPRAHRQQRAEATLGVIYRDVTYDELDLELDGRLYHDNVEQRDRDLDRDLDAAVAQRVAVRLGYGQVVGRPCRTAARIALLLRARGWTGRPSPCGPECDLGGGWLSVGDSGTPPRALATATKNRRVCPVVLGSQT